MNVPSLPKTPPILTLTVNPALDVSASTAHVASEHKLHCRVTRIDPDGGYRKGTGTWAALAQSNRMR
ncbi:fructose-1-phosphate kinase PfkB-like protein [Cryobacterium psychrotolerans]|nr:fructose-1-phosphate kinase PfkB-like protein [Cryobacterium psychrotolerans]